MDENETKQTIKLWKTDKVDFDASNKNEQNLLFHRHLWKKKILSQQKSYHYHLMIIQILK